MLYIFFIRYTSFLECVFQLISTIELNEFSLFQTKSKRKRCKTKRYGQTDDEVNKDDFFDDSQSENSTNDISMDDDDSTVATNCKNTNSATDLQTQLAKVEAKIEDVSSAVQKILRMVISMTTNRTCDGTIAPDFLSFFPLTTEEAVDKFEQDLSVSGFRNAVVIFSVLIYLSH